MPRRHAMLCAVTLAVTSCTHPRGDAPEGAGLSRADRQAVAAAWREAGVLSLSTDAACDTLVIGTPVARCQPRARDTVTLAALAPRAVALVAQLDARRSTATLQALALLDAASAPHDHAALTRAAALLDEAAGHADAGAALHTDRAALHLQRHALSPDVGALLTALDAASLAARMAPRSWQACWNRAVALTWLVARHAARDEWARCATLAPVRAAAAVVDRGSPEIDTARSVALAGRWREAAREYAWSTALPLWGRSIRAAHADSGALALRWVAQLHHQVHSAAPDRSLDAALRDAVASTAPGVAPTRAMRLGHAHELLAWARSSAARQQPVLAAMALDSALALTSERDEVRRWIRLQQANLALTTGHARDAMRRYRQLRRAIPDSTAIFDTRVAWGEALALISLGESAEAYERLGRVAARCRQLQLETCQVRTRSFRAELAAVLGDADATAHEIQLAVAATAGAPTSTGNWSILLGLRRDAEARGLPHAAAAMDGEALALARAFDRPDLAMEALYDRASARLEAGDAAGAATDLAEARTRWLPRLAAADRAFFAPELLRVDGELRRAHDPVASRRLLDSALVLLGGSENEVRRSELQLSHARSVLAAGDTTKALRELHGVLTTLRARSTDGTTVFDRARLARVTAATGLLAAGALRRRGDPAAALYALSGRPFLTPQRTAPCCAVPGSTTLALRQVGDSVWVWTRHRDTWALRAVPLPAHEVTAAAALDSQALHHVYEALVRPFVAPVPGAAPLLRLDVRGVLGTVPWSALRDRARRQYLVEQATIVLVDGDMPSRDAHVTASGAEQVVLIDAAPRAGDRALPGAAREVAMLDSLWQGRSRQVDGRRGAEGALAALRTATIVHFAGHAMLDHARPERSYLAFPAPSDSMLIGAQVARKNFGHVRLVILSACETRGTVTGSTSGFDSLAGAFLDAGADAVIGAQWPLDDAATTTLMRDVHAGVRAGLTPAQALRAAQVSAIHSGTRTLASPRVWAGLVTMGR